jgi:hypothetical protein
LARRTNKQTPTPVEASDDERYAVIGRSGEGETWLRWLATWHKSREAAEEDAPALNTLASAIQGSEDRYAAILRLHKAD